MAQLISKNISRYLVNVISNYLSNKKIKAEDIELEVSAGIPQGSVLGPTLWNIMYDSVLRVDLPSGAQIIGFADDLGLVVIEEDEKEITRKANGAMDKVGSWLTEHHLGIAPEKTKVVVMKGPRKRSGIKLFFQGKEITPVKSIGYLGVQIDDRGTYGAHVLKTVKKGREERSSAANNHVKHWRRTIGRKKGSIGGSRPLNTLIQGIGVARSAKNKQIQANNAGKSAEENIP